MKKQSPWLYQLLLLLLFLLFLLLLIGWLQVGEVGVYVLVDI